VDRVDFQQTVSSVLDEIDNPEVRAVFLQGCRPNDSWELAQWFVRNGARLQKGGIVMVSPEEGQSELREMGKDNNLDDKNDAHWMGRVILAKQSRDFLHECLTNGVSINTVLISPRRAMEVIKAYHDIRVVEELRDGQCPRNRRQMIKLIILFEEPRFEDGTDSIELLLHTLYHRDPIVADSKTLFSFVMASSVDNE
ncbi:hypothetical protein PENTCL1PPCAC_17487, partial [Pristionchus entomophagus]